MKRQAVVAPSPQSG